ncbi:MAG: hypothetical protein FWF90_04390 [Promicromonosporaceae bacterium]|nr:hypothetical protein [Promicromonosporaceae bacterium]
MPAHHRATAVLGVLAVAFVAVFVVPAPARATPLAGNEYYLTNGTTGGQADVTFAYGKPDDTVLVGDWNGDGKDTLGVRRGNQYFLTNGTTGGQADISFAFGRPDDVVLVGDWNGDGKDTLAVRRGNQYFLTNGTTGGQADVSFAYGRAGDTVLVGDWNGDGKDTLGVRRASQYFLTNGTTGGQADVSFAYGRPDDVVLVGDWNADGKDTLGVRRASQYFLTNGTTGGNADITFAYGKADDIVLVGDWNGDGKDTLGVRRSEAPPATFAGSGTFAVGSQIPPGRYRTTGLYPASYCNLVRFSSTATTPENALGGSQIDSAGQIYVDVLPSDVMVRTSGCNTWTQVYPDDLPALRTSFPDGQYRVGKDIAPGFYRGTSIVDTTSGAPRACGATAVRDFADVPLVGTSSVVAAAGSDNGGPLVFQVLPSDAGLILTGCDTWTAISPSDPPALQDPVDGTYRVGIDIAPGTYETAGKQPPNGSCTVVAVSNFRGGTASWISGSGSDPGAPAVFTVLPTDVGFTSSRCGAWHRVTANDPPHFVAPTDGVYRVGFDVAPGTYVATVPNNLNGCRYEALRDFRGLGGPSIIRNGNAFQGESATFTILASDTGFMSSGCGSWVKLS